MTKNQKRQKCPYCHDDKRIISEEEAEFVSETWVHEGYLLERGLDNPEGVLINYCPMCGRKLW